MYSDAHTAQGSLADCGEDALLADLLRDLPVNPALLTGPGDDCAVTERDAEWDALLKTDCVVEGQHFLPDTAPHLIGRKALARTVSDIAAMGGEPEHALITLLAHPSRPVCLIRGIYEGINELANEYGISIAGGECSALPQDGLAISVALTGKAPKGSAILRSTAQAGDLIAVTGVLGGSFPTGHHLSFTPRIPEGRALRASGLITAMMDLSDGLGSDLPRLAKASGLGFNIDESALPCRPGYTPRQAVTDGEDYELLFTFPPDARSAVSRIFREQFPCTPIHTVGVMTAHNATALSAGWQHFKN